MVSYNEKHNLANGEDNRDGDNHNESWNCGVEGETDDPEIRALRRKQVKNFMAILMLSQGVPMILAGDEVLKSQQGNNNCYCQDNELSWFDWSLLEKNQEMFLFTREMIRLRRRHPCLMQRQFLTGSSSVVSGMEDVAWHGLRLHEPQWDNPSSRVLACTLSRVEPDEEDLHIIMNMSEDNLSMQLPKLENRSWNLAVDTSRTTPEDVIEPKKQQPLSRKTVQVNSRSVVVYESR